MKKTTFVLLLTNFSNVIFASFPVNNINNQIYNQSEIASTSSPVIGIILGIIAILSPIAYLLSIFWHLSKPIPKDTKQKKKFFKKRIFIIFTPLILFLIIYIYAYSTMMKISL